MGKRHNRKRTRSRRPRLRSHDGGNAQMGMQCTRSGSGDTMASVWTNNSPSASSILQHPLAPPNPTTHHWHQAHHAWQDRLRINLEREQEVETQRLRIFGGMPGDETSLLEPMLKVVTDLFDGFTDYEDP